METKLDNPAFYSLLETHQDFAIDYDGCKFYDPSYCPFGGYTNSDNIINAIDSYSELISNFYVIGDKPKFSGKVILNKELVCNQMLLGNTIDLDIAESIIELITVAQKAELFELVNLVQPGYFRPKTSAMGSYFGIYKNNQLVAVTGERMQMNEFTEISAVVTHPEHTGKGYAKQLVAHTSNKIFTEGKTPYLHVAENNTGAIALYEKLGFWTRRKISFWNFIKNTNP